MKQNKAKKMTPQARQQALKELVESLDIPFADIPTLDRAFTHTSYANENKRFGVQHNERLEFLGDAVLDLIIGEYLFRTYPSMSEGELTKLKASVVCETSLAECSQSLNFGRYLLLGKGEDLTGGRTRPSILADTFEAVLGAIYLGTSYKVASSYALAYLKPYLEKATMGEIGTDFKTLLQEWVQKDGDAHISYILISESGPDHDKSFLMDVQIDGQSVGEGQGKTKKEAEQHAAKMALATLRR